MADEKALHSKLEAATQRANGEWFHVTMDTLRVLVEHGAHGNTYGFKSRSEIKTCSRCGQGIWREDDGDPRRKPTGAVGARLEAIEATKLG
jgi:hypothetical protein